MPRSLVLSLSDNVLNLSKNTECRTVKTLLYYIKQLCQFLESFCRRQLGKAEVPQLDHAAAEPHDALLVGAEGGV